MNNTKYLKYQFKEDKLVQIFKYFEIVQFAQPNLFPNKYWPNNGMYVN